MTSDKRAMKEEGCEAQDVSARKFTHIPIETLRDLFGVVAESVFERWAEENATGHTIKSPHTSSGDSVIFSASTFIALLQAFVSLKRDIELDVIAQQYAFNHEYRELCNRIAAIISHTYIELGDAAEFADDEALLMIRDLLLAFDDTIMNRNRFRRITSHYKSGYKFGVGK